MPRYLQPKAHYTQHKIASPTTKGRKLSPVPALRCPESEMTRQLHDTLHNSTFGRRGLRPTLLPSLSRMAETPVVWGVPLAADKLVRFLVRGTSHVKGSCAFKKQGEVTVNHITLLSSWAIEEMSSLF